MRLLAFAAVFSTLASPAWAASFNRRPYLQNVTTTSIIVKWAQSSGAATVTYGPMGAATQSVSESATISGDHQVTLSGLMPSTRYQYSVDAGGGTVAAGSFSTAALFGEPFTFILYGDNRSNDSDHQEVVNAMLNEQVDFLLNTGDTVNTPLDYQDFFDIEAPLLANNPLFPTLGNHEYASGTGTALWTQLFATPSQNERYYSFDYGNSRFIVLDFNASTTAQMSWLRDTLADARAKGVVHIFAAMHHSPYDSGEHGENKTAQTAWVPLFQQYGLDAIFGGHDHDYERGYVAATNQRYIVSGGGGAPLYTGNSMKPYQQKFSAVLHYVKISVDGPLVTVNAYHTDGTPLDSFMWMTQAQMPDGGAPDLSTANDLASTPSDGGAPDLSTTNDLATASDDAATTTTTTMPTSPENGCGCSTAARTPAPAPLAVALLLLVFLRRRRA